MEIVHDIHNNLLPLTAKKNDEREKHRKIQYFVQAAMCLIFFEIYKILVFFRNLQNIVLLCLIS